MTRQRPKGYYVHVIKKNAASGVYSKIQSQLRVFGKSFDMTEIIVTLPEESKPMHFIRSKLLHIRRDFRYDEVLGRIDSPDFVYIRRPIVLNKRFVEFLGSIRKKAPDCRIFLEIPTYPYANELYSSVGRRRAERMMAEEERNLPELRRLVDRIVSFYDNGDIFGIKTITTMNGVDVDGVPVVKKQKREETINLLAVAVFQPSHGYERIIRSLTEYYEAGGERSVRLYLVGDGKEMPMYRQLADNELVKDRIVFCGRKSGRQLDEVYDKADIGLGCFGYYKRGIASSSPLKTREYMARGLPIVYAARESCFDEEPADFALEVANDDSPIDMNLIIDFYDGLFEGGRSLPELHQQVRGYAKRHFDMAVVMEPVVREACLSRTEL